MASYILNYLFLCCFVRVFDVRLSYIYIYIYIYIKRFWKGEKVTIDGSVQFASNNVRDKQILNESRRLCVTLRNLRNYKPR
jgi:hypothetical protein